MSNQILITTLEQLLESVRSGRCLSASVDRSVFNATARVEEVVIRVRVGPAKPDDLRGITELVKESGKQDLLDSIKIAAGVKKT